ncbi:MAG: xylulokinase [Armatimonadia bacterium]|nr:xylulokinase [Armatimonadia bacterium]
MGYLAGIDIGTSGTKTLIITDAGEVVASATVEYPLLTPRPGWAEQHPQDWWQASVDSLRQAVVEAGISGTDIQGVGLSGQMHGSVFLDEKGQVIRPALLWCDQRTGAQCDWINETAGESLVVEETSNPVLTGFTAPKIIWLRQKEPENYAKMTKCLLPKDYVRYRLTGEFHSEVSDASGTALFNVKERRWSTALLNKIDLDPSVLPEVHESPVASAVISGEAAELMGLKPGTPVVGGGGDQAAGAVGNGIVSQGIVSSTLGTSGVLFAFLEEPLVDPELRTHTFCHAVPGKWHVMGVMLSAGGSFRWIRDTLCGAERDVSANLGQDPYVLMCEEAAAAPAGCEGLVFLPYLTGERTPYPDPAAKGVFYGLHLRHQRAHMIRAVMEGVAFGMKDSFDILDAMGVPMTQVRASGGGARSPLWRQIQADVTGRTHSVINVEEGPALGVALLAGVGTDAWGSVEEACEAAIDVVGSTEPIPENRDLYAKCHPIYQGLYRDLSSRFQETAKLFE